MTSASDSAQGDPGSRTGGATSRRRRPSGRAGLRERTIADVAQSLAPGWRCEDIFAWPPDGFAFSAAVLSESGAYRLIVSP
ncbi:MAG TPA: hypothetical protein VFV33_25520, partial [Gemmatimonadaceae bacterium]|nr:hypothetical protein [Gemmatimonadaceae bacterium]